MAEATPPRDVYYNEGYEDSPLSDAEREQFRDAIKTILCRIPGERHFEPDHPAIAGINLKRVNQTEISLDVYLDEKEVDADIDADERATDDGIQGSADDPNSIRDLGHVWSHLETDLITELVFHLDLPEYRKDGLERSFLGDVGFTCTLVTEDGTAHFATYVGIPGHIQTIYDNDEFEVAEHFGIPMLD